MNVKDFPPSSGGDPVRRWMVWVDDQGVVLLLMRRECNCDVAWVSSCVFRDEVLYFLYEVSVSEHLGFDVNGAYLVHHRVSSLGNLTRRDGVPVEGRSGAGPLGDL